MYTRLISPLRTSAASLASPGLTVAVEVKIPAGRFREGKPGDPNGLSRREVAVLKLLGDGLSPRQIAERSGLTLQTVYMCVSQIYSWLGVKDISVALEMAKPVIEERADDLPTDRRMSPAKPASDEPTPLQLETLRAVARHRVQARAYEELGIPYITGPQRLRLLMRKVGAENLEDLFEVAAERGWIDAAPDWSEDEALTFTQHEAEMMRAHISSKSVAAAGRSLGLSKAAANSRMHTIYPRLGVHGGKEALEKLRGTGLDAANLLHSA